MKIHHIVKVHFDRRKPEIDAQWIRDRCKFFAENTLPSLRNQTYKGFRMWLSCGVNMTIHDLETVRSIPVEDSLVTWNPEHAPEPFMTTPIPEDVDYVYVTRIDSDDLYAPDALELANSRRPARPGAVEASMFRRGYLHDVRTGEVGVYHGSSTPFHTMMIPRSVFCDPKKYAALDYGDHSQVNSRFPTQVLPDWRFTVLVHGSNFISDMSYGREKIFNVERSWSVERFLQQPVTFDVDDFCDRWNCLPDLDLLKQQYPNFKCTLFTIPFKTSQELVEEARKRDWVELAAHGFHHEPNEELKAMSDVSFSWHFNNTNIEDSMDLGKIVRGFRPPGWYITPEHVKVLNDFKMWVALHKRDERRLGPLCEHGYYVCGDRPYWHGHTSGEGQRAHSVCGNGIRECLSELLRKWPRDQRFSFVSESVGVIK